MIKSDIRNKLKSLIGTLSLISIIVILLIYGIVVIYFTVNIPFFDDFYGPAIICQNIQTQMGHGIKFI